MKSVRDRCGACNGFCCTREPWTSVRIEKNEIDRMRKLGAKVIVESEYSAYMPMGKDECDFVKDGKCSIYHKRPEACREFDCAKSESFLDYFKRFHPDTYKLVYGEETS